MLGLGLRSAVKRNVRSALHRLDGWLDDAPEPEVRVPEPAPMPEPAPGAAAVTPVLPVEAAPAPVVEVEAPPAVPALDPAAVEAVIDDMIRPALQSDGGDIVLVKVEGVDVYVRLVGACSSCPSSTVTMKMGIERLLQEEFPQIGQIIQVEGLL